MRIASTNMITREKLVKLKSQGFKLSVIAREAGISVPLVTAYVRGTKGVSENNRVKIESALERIMQ